MRELTASGLAERHSFSRPIVEALRSWLEGQLVVISGYSTLAESIRHIFAFGSTDTLPPRGRIELEANPVERAITPVALGRKNHLFAGSDGWALRMGLISEDYQTLSRPLPIKPSF